MKRKTIGIIGVSLSLVTAAAVLGGCGKDKQASTDVSNFGDTELAKELKIWTGVEVEYIHPPQGQEAEKFSIVVASSNLPDIIEYNWLEYPGGPAKAIKEGVIIDIAQYKDKAKNVFDYLDNNNEIKKLATTDAQDR